MWVPFGDDCMKPKDCLHDIHFRMHILYRRAPSNSLEGMTGPSKLTPVPPKKVRLEPYRGNIWMFLGSSQ